MSTGIGLALLGMWINAAACWNSSTVPGRTALSMTILALIFTAVALVAAATRSFT